MSSLLGLLLCARAISASAVDAANAVDNPHATLLKSPPQAQFVASPGVPECTRGGLCIQGQRMVIPDQALCDEK